MIFCSQSKFENVYRLFIDLRGHVKIVILLFVGYGRKMSLWKTFRVKVFACSSYISEVNLQACMAARSSPSNQENASVSLLCQAIVLDLVRPQILKSGILFLCIPGLSFSIQYDFRYRGYSGSVRHRRMCHWFTGWDRNSNEGQPSIH